MWRALGRAAEYAGPLLLAALLFVGWRAWGDLAELRQGLSDQKVLLQRVLGKVAQMTTYTTTWRSGGIEYSVSTTCREGETRAECLARHEDAVAQMQQLHPPDPPR